MADQFLRRNPVRAAMYDQPRCANCGEAADTAQAILQCGATYDGEFVCCNQCADELEEFGCPLDEPLDWASVHQSVKESYNG